MKKDKNNQNINNIPKYQWGNYFKKPIKWLAHQINNYGSSKHPFITTGTSYAYAIGDEKRRHPELTEQQIHEIVNSRIKQNRKKLGLPTDNNTTPSQAAAGLALGSLYYPWLAVPDIVFDIAASIDEPSTSNNIHTVADFPETVAKFTPSKIDDYVAKGVQTLGNIDDAVSTSGRNMFSNFDKKSGKINNTTDKTSVRESTNIRYRKNGGQIRKMQTASGGPINYKRWDNAKTTSYTIPFIKEKAIKLTNAGKATGARLSTNLLDSLANNAYQAGLPIRKGLGIAFKESTFGNPTDDESAWNLSSKIREQFNNKYPGTYQHINNGHTVLGQHLINYHKGDVNHEVFYEGNPDAHKSIIQEAFEFYKQHPDKYNPGQKNYQQLIDKRGDEAMQSPEIKKWYKEWEKSKAQIFRPEPYKINTNIQNTAQEFIPLKKQGGKMNILEFLKNGSGIHIKEKNKGKFTSYCGGKVTDECIQKGKNSSNPAIRKRATFAANARKWKHKEGGIIKAEEGTKFNWQSALTNVGTNLFNSYLQSRVQNNKINSEAEAVKAENEVDLNQYFWDIYQQELAKAQQEEEQKNKAISAMNDTVINSSPLVTQKKAYDRASQNYGTQKANQDARNKAIDEQAKAAKSSVITDAISGVVQNGLGMLKDYYGSKNNNTSTINTSTTSNSYFDNSKYKKFGTFNPDGSMNMLGGTFTINGGYKPNQPQLFNYQPLKLNV